MALSFAEDDSLFRIIFDTIPFPVFVVDADIRILGHNQSATSLFSGSPEQYLRMSGGDALRCIHSRETSGGCGHSSSCKACVIRNSVCNSYSGMKVVRERHRLQSVAEDGVRDFHMYVTTAPFAHRGETFVLLILEDITELTKAEARIKQQNEFLSLVLDSLPHPFYVIDAGDYTIRMANRAAARGGLPDSMKCHAHSHRNEKPCDEKEHPCPLIEVKKTKKPVVVEHVHFDVNGEARSYEVHGYPIFDEKENVCQLIEYALDITERKRAEEELKQINRQLEDLSKTDGLTGLHNSRYFYTRLKEEMSRAERYGHLLSVMIVDVDYFKQYNDAHGHLMGDNILKDIASCLKRSMRGNDLVARYGGDEFSIILPETGKAAAGEIGERIREIVSEQAFPYEESQPGGNLTISLGIATFPNDAGDIKRLVGQADNALYRAKENGRNRVEAASVT